MRLGDASVKVLGVSHRYGRKEALIGVDLNLPVGVTGLLGPNGAGKTTLMKLLATATPLRHGEIHYGNLDVGRDSLPEVRSLIGYLPQRFELMEWASVARNVAYAAWAHGVPREEVERAAHRVLEAVDLVSRAGSRARSLSGGMRQRLGLACALVHRPAVAILDEPTVGLDPVQRSELRRLITQLGRESVVLVSTHLVEDLAAAAEHVVVMNDGRVRFTGGIEDLRRLGETSTTSHSSVLEAGYEQALGLKR